MLRNVRMGEFLCVGVYMTLHALPRNPDMYAVAVMFRNKFNTNLMNAV